MKQTVDFQTFRDTFRAYDRADQFSYEALSALFEYLDQWEADTGEELELDVIAFCCDFAEDSWQDIAASYSIELDGLDSDEDKQEAVADYLTDEGCYVAHVGGGFVYRQH
jgi:predicted ArsR family transcriptional regulator